MEVIVMAIEPLGSVMTVQAQPVQKVEAAKPVTNSTEAVATPNQPVVDPTTAAVLHIEGKGDSTSQNEENEQAASEQLKQAVSQANKRMQSSEMQFGIHEGTKRITLKIIDKDTKEIIKEFPPEKNLDMIAKVWELAGILVDEKR